MLQLVNPEPIRPPRTKTLAEREADAFGGSLRQAFETLSQTADCELTRHNAKKALAKFPKNLKQHA
jgi:hypothetical protein